MNHLGDTNKMVGEDHIRDATKMVSDTPRTDDQIGHAGSTMSAIRIEFARQLERELNAANYEVQHLREVYIQLQEGNERQRQRIKRLEEAGDNLHFGWIDGYLDPRCLDEWRKAKEAKP